MRLKRIVTSLLGFPLVAAVLILINNKYILDIFFAIIAAISIHEYFKSFQEKARPIVWIRIPGFCLDFITSCIFKFTESIFSTYNTFYHTDLSASYVFTYYHHKYEN